MIVERTMSEGWLSNSYLVADEAGGHGVVIDTGGPMQPILEKIAELDLTITHVLCTHHHGDHVVHNAAYQRLFDCPIGGHALERAEFGSLDLELHGGEQLSSGTLRLSVLHVPGHTRGQLAFVAGSERVFTGDTLFRGSVGGTRAPGHGTFDELRRSVMEVLMRLPPEMEVYPGHTDSTTIGEEWEHNAFVRAWRGLDATLDKPCSAFGQRATLLVRARDYDGGGKCWVRFADGIDDVVPGSAVTAA